MKNVSITLAGLLLAASSHAALAEWQPLSERSINAATLKDWQASVRVAEDIAEAARADPTMPPVEAAGPEGANDAVGRTISLATRQAAADGIDLGGEAPEVPLAEEEELTIESPAYSTDSPDQANLETLDAQKHPEPFLIRLQVLLDRAHVSPGVIDGFEGDNTRTAIAAFEAMHGLPQDGEIDDAVWARLARDGAAVLTTYVVSAADLAQPYVGALPADYSELARLDRIGFSGPAEMLAERFHMDEDLLRALNPAADFTAPGTAILVPAIGEAPSTPVAGIIVDKNEGRLTAYGADGAVVMSAPASVGSDETPSPSGRMRVAAVAPDPTYHYDPANFTQGDNTEPLTLPAGPNGPVGSVWIDLTEPSYGIHGTPDPARIAKSQSHGCVRLTNWDAEALSKLVQPEATTVAFTKTAEARLVAR